MKKNSLLAIFCLTIALAVSACGGKSDADVQKEVTGRVKTPGVTVTTVKDGVVTLGGSVTTQVQKEQAVAAAKGEGVKSVTDNIQIIPSGTTPMNQTAPATR